MHSQKKISAFLAAFSVFSLKLAIEMGARSVSQLFEIATLLNFGFLLIGLIYVGLVRKDYIFDFASPSKSILQTAQLFALYNLIDCVCLAFLSLQSYFIIKFCLTATFKVSRDITKGIYIYTTVGITHRASRVVVSAILIPVVITIDLLLQYLEPENIPKTTFPLIYLVNRS